jgi:6-phosphogluconolactonase
MQKMRHLVLMTIALWPLLGRGQTGTATLVFVGSFTEGRPATGIRVLRLDAAKHRLVELGRVEGLVNPSYVTLAADGRTLYACTESKMPGAGQVRAFAVDSVQGALRELNAVPSGGENPVYAAVDATGRWVANANYTEAGVVVHAREADGSLGTAMQAIRFTGTSGLQLAAGQEGPHPHAAVFGPDNRHLYVPDLGADLIRVFHFDATAAQPLRAADSLDVPTVPGAGPRHLVFHPGGRYAYCAEELSGSVAVYAVDGGRLTRLQRLTTYAKQPLRGASADVHVSADGRQLYVSNRGDKENSLACFAIDAATGTLSLLGHQDSGGDGPRSFALDATGEHLVVANSGTGTVVLFVRDAATGLLREAFSTVKLPGASSVCMRKYGVEGR